MGSIRRGGRGVPALAAGTLAIVAALAGFYWAGGGGTRSTAPPRGPGRGETGVARPDRSQKREVPAHGEAPSLREQPSAHPGEEPALSRRISGVVVEAGTHAPVAGLPLTFSSEGSEDAYATTRDDGTFETHTALPAGELVVFDGHSYAGLALSLDAEHRQIVLGRLTVEEGRDLEGVVIEHPFSGRVSGRVVDGEGQAVPGARVFPFLDARGSYAPGIEIQYPDLRVARTDVSGFVEIDRLPTDRRLELVAEADGFTTGLSEEFVASPFGTTVADVVLRRPGSIRLLVLDAEGSPLGGVRALFFLVESEDGRARSGSRPPATTGNDGILEIEFLHPGRYSIELEKPLHVFRDAVAAVVVEGERSEVTARASPARLAISGTVVERTLGRLPEGLVVDARRSGEDTFVATADVDSEGRFTLDPPGPGSYWLHAGRHALDAGPEIEAEAGDSGLHLTWSAPAAAVRARVLHAATSEPIAEAEVRFQIDGGPPALSLVTDRLGLTTASRMSPARYAAAASARGYAQNRVAFEIAQDERGERTIDIRLGAGRSVSGRVIDSDGEPVAGAVVAVVDGPLPWNRTRVLTRADGTFTLDSLPEKGGEVALVQSGVGILARASAEPGSGEIVLVEPVRRR